MILARFGAERFGLSGVGLRSIDSSRFAEGFPTDVESSSSDSSRRLFDLNDGEDTALVCTIEEANWWKAWGFV